MVSTKRKFANVSGNHGAGRIYKHFLTLLSNTTKQRFSNKIFERKQTECWDGFARCNNSRFSLK